MTILTRSPTLCAIVLRATGQDLRQCAMCMQCETGAEPELDLTIRRLIGCVLADDDSVLESRTLWSGRTLSRTTHLCPFGLELEAVFLALREEAWRRGVVDAII